MADGLNGCFWSRQFGCQIRVVGVFSQQKACEWFVFEWIVARRCLVMRLNWRKELWSPQSSFPRWKYKWVGCRMHCSSQSSKTHNVFVQNRTMPFFNTVRLLRLSHLHSFFNFLTLSDSFKHNLQTKWRKPHVLWSLTPLSAGGYRLLVPSKAVQYKGFLIWPSLALLSVLSAFSPVW